MVLIDTIRPRTNLCLFGDIDGKISLQTLNNSTLKEIDSITFGKHNIIQAADLIRLNQK